MKGKQTFWLLVAIAVGSLLGFVSASPLSGLGAWNLAIWGIGNVALGNVPGSRNSKMLRLGAYGLTLGFGFMAFGYSGAEPLNTRVFPFLLIGLFSAACAIVVGGIVHLVRQRLHH
ncbi:MAG: hypothetical protein JJE47_15335 [Acidimicrobiia bacterium]|nr:hypothetical protein [Acidimicrobiia bacterium]